MLNLIHNEEDLIEKHYLDIKDLFKPKYQYSVKKDKTFVKNKQSLQMYTRILKITELKRTRVEKKLYLTLHIIFHIIPTKERFNKLFRIIHHILILKNLD